MVPAGVIVDLEEDASPELVVLDVDHPGFHEADYRRRRNEIAQAALDHHGDGPVPRVAYTGEEHEVWREVWRNLEPLHFRYACSEYLEASDRIRLSRDSIPQLADVNATIGPIHGFRMRPVAGLVSAKAFLRQLGHRVFLSTQYMRHHSVPLYTPEPDVVHELIGHAATFAHPQFARLNQAFGEAALRASDAQIEQIGRLYWYTLEFGVVRERGSLKVYGAGLLSSYGEIQVFRDAAIRPLDFDSMGTMDYDITRYQPVLFAAASFSEMVDRLGRFFDDFGVGRSAS